MRIGALWVLINLTWPDDPESAPRREIFKSLGFPDVLTQLLEKEQNIDVSERIKTALSNFNSKKRAKIWRLTVKVHPLSLYYSDLCLMMILGIMFWVSLCKYTSVVFDLF